MIHADVIDKAKETVHDGAVFAERGAKSVSTSARSALRTFGDAVAVIRSLGIDDVLGTVGLAKKQSGARWLGTFGTGMTVGLGVGVGVGMLFAPRAGVDTRLAIAKAARDIFAVDASAATSAVVEETTDSPSQVSAPEEQNGARDSVTA